MKVKYTANASLGQALRDSAERMHLEAKRRKKGLKTFHPVAAAIKETDKFDPLLAEVKEYAAKVEQENMLEAEKFRNIAAIRGEDSKIGRQFIQDAEERERRARLISEAVEQSHSAWTKQYGEHA